MLDDATRRQLRFSLFLQGFAALMLLVAAGIRIAALGWDAVTWVLVVGLGLVIAFPQIALWLPNHVYVK